MCVCVCVCVCVLVCQNIVYCSHCLAFQLYVSVLQHDDLSFAAILDLVYQDLSALWKGAEITVNGTKRRIRVALLAIGKTNERDRERRETEREVERHT